MLSNFSPRSSIDLFGDEAKKKIKNGKKKFDAFPWRRNDRKKQIKKMDGERILKVCCSGIVKMLIPFPQNFGSLQSGILKKFGMKAGTYIVKIEQNELLWNQK